MEAQDIAYPGKSDYFNTHLSLQQKSIQSDF